MCLLVTAQIDFFFFFSTTTCLKTQRDTKRQKTHTSHIMSAFQLLYGCTTRKETSKSCRSPPWANTLYSFEFSTFMHTSCLYFRSECDSCNWRLCSTSFSTENTQEDQKITQKRTSPCPGSDYRRWDYQKKKKSEWRKSSPSFLSTITNDSFHFSWLCSLWFLLSILQSLCLLGEWFSNHSMFCMKTALLMLCSSMTFLLEVCDLEQHPLPIETTTAQIQEKCNCRKWMQF